MRNIATKEFSINFGVPVEIPGEKPVDLVVRREARIVGLNASASAEVWIRGTYLLTEPAKSTWVVEAYPLQNQDPITVKGEPFGFGYNGSFFLLTRYKKGGPIEQWTAHSDKLGESITPLFPEGEFFRSTFDEGRFQAVSAKKL